VVGQGKEISRRQKSRPSPQEHDGRGGGGNSAVFLQKIEASPAALLVKAMHMPEFLPPTPPSGSFSRGRMEFLAALLFKYPSI